MRMFRSLNICHILSVTPYVKDSSTDDLFSAVLFVFSNAGFLAFLWLLYWFSFCSYCLLRAFVTDPSSWFLLSSSVRRKDLHMEMDGDVNQRWDIHVYVWVSCYSLSNLIRWLSHEEQV